MYMYVHIYIYIYKESGIGRRQELRWRRQSIDVKWTINKVLQPRNLVHGLNPFSFAHRWDD